MSVSAPKSDSTVDSRPFVDTPHDFAPDSAALPAGPSAAGPFLAVTAVLDSLIEVLSKIHERALEDKHPFVQETSFKGVLDKSYEVLNALQTAGLKNHQETQQMILVLRKAFKDQNPEEAKVLSATREQKAIQEASSAGEKTAGP